MTTLHRVADATKKIAIGFVIGVLCITFLVITIRFLITVKETLFPTPPPPPTVAFGKIPVVNFPIPVVTTPLTYTINTLTGSLPVLDDRVTVYKLQQPQISFSNLDQAKTLAATNNFTDAPIALSDSVYQWKNSNAQTLTLNIQTFDFLLSSNYLSDPTVQAASNLADPATAVRTSQDFFTKYMSAFPTDIDTTQTQTALLTIQNNTLVPATSLSSAQVIRVDFYQGAINKVPVYYPHYPQSLLETYVASGQYGQQVYAATFIHKNIDTTTSATYPIKTAKQAFEELQKGQGYIANYDTPDKPVTIRNATLGYYLSEDMSQAYMWPIIVFQGDNNFYGFVPALTDEWVQK